MFNVQNIHIEISSKCTLKCPRCPRTELAPEHLNKEITLAEFQLAFPSDVLKEIKSFAFCGDVGDPIYATEFLEIIEYLKVHDIRVIIITNGSYKSTEWWAQLGTLLRLDDQVTFSVDGWDQDSNNLYRVNSNYDSIVTGIKALRVATDCHIVWSTIIFNFNETQLDNIKTTAKELGVDHFQVVNSTKFDGRYLVNGVDPLKPTVTNPTNNYIMTNVSFQDRSIPLIPNRQFHKWAKCLNWQKLMFINVEGLVFPCPWFNTGYQQNPFIQKYKDKLSIKTRPLSDILNDPLWNEFMTSLELSPLDVCKFKCKGNQ